MIVVKFNKVHLLVRRQWFEHSRIYLVGLALLLLSLAFLFAITYHWRDSFSGGVRNGILLIGLFIGGGLFTNSLLGELTNKSSGMWLLTLPASASEKILTVAFFSIIIYPALFIALFCIVDQAYVSMISTASFKMDRVDLLKNGFYEFFFSYLNFTGMILLGSIFFSKASFIKTMLLIICIFFFVSSGNNFILQLMTGLASIDSNTPFGGFQFRHNGENVYVNMPVSSERFLSFIFRVIVPFSLWYIGTIRLKEKEL